MRPPGASAIGSRLARLPIFYGWIIVAVVFVTMAVGINARTAFSLLFPPILDEFGWDRGQAAGVFSFGFLISALMSPLVGRLMDRTGPRLVVEIGVVLLASGLLLAVLADGMWQVYATLGLLVGCGVNCLGYSVQSQFLPLWFVRRRGLAIGIAFSGVGVGGVVLLPWLQAMIEQQGWRAACLALGLIVAVVLAPLNLLLWKRPGDIGLEPDGGRAADGAGAAMRRAVIVDADWAAVDWTLARAVRTTRFWWLCLSFFWVMYAWYAVQIHQTKYLIEVGVSPMQAGWALGLVSLVAIPGQIWLGHLSDRIGREWVWTIGCGGFVACYLALIALGHVPAPALVFLMVVAQGTLGYSLTSVMGPIGAEVFEGRQFGSIYGTMMLVGIAGGAAGPWVTGLLHDVTGGYAAGFWLALAASLVSAAAMWLAAPRKVRMVAGQVGRQRQ